VTAAFKDTTKTGLIALPRAGETIIAGHSMVAVGFDTSRNVFIFRNSWGRGWGAQGHCFVPFDYLTGPHCGEVFALCA
jgi:C1A family cysteine protease